MNTGFNRQRTTARLVGLLLLSGCLGVSRAQANLELSWFKAAGGGGTSASGLYTLSGTIGQPEAAQTAVGGRYALNGGFWSWIAPGPPTLFVSQLANQVVVYWQNSGNWTLQQNSQVNVSAGWGPSSGVATANGTNFLILNHPVGTLFFRLKQ